MGLGGVQESVAQTDFRALLAGSAHVIVFFLFFFFPKKNFVLVGKFKIYSFSKFKFTTQYYSYSHLAMY